YCVETPPGTRYNPPFNISENLFFNRSNRIRSRK
ncbi:sugar ABC transporter ATP-binding protein, partial [Neisseria gonorrhoeae]